MGVVIGFVWLVIGYVLMQTGIQVWAALMLPNPVERARQRIMRQPYVSFFTGLAFWGVTMLFASALIRIPGAGSLAGYALMAPMLAASIVGGAAFSRILAERIRKMQRNESEISALVGGALATTVATLLPVIGWFMFLPIVGWIGIGAGLLGIVSKKRVAEAPAAAPVSGPPPFPVADPWTAFAAQPAAPAAPPAPATPPQSWSGCSQPAGQG